MAEPEYASEFLGRTMLEMRAGMRSELDSFGQGTRKRVEATLDQQIKALAERLYKGEDRPPAAELRVERIARLRRPGLVTP